MLAKSLSFVLFGWANDLKVLRLMTWRALFVAALFAFSTSSHATTYWCADGDYLTAADSSEEAVALTCPPHFSEYQATSASCAGSFQDNGWQAFDNAGCTLIYTYMGPPNPNAAQTITENNIVVARCAEDITPPVTWSYTLQGCVNFTVVSHDTAKDCPVGNPFYPLTGAKHQVEILPISIGGINATLTYDQRFLIAAVPNSPDMPFYPYATSGLLSRNWYFNFDRRIVPMLISGSVATHVIFNGDGTWTSYNLTPNNNAQFISDIDPADFVVASGTNWLHINTRLNFEELYSAAGQLQEIDYSDGRRLVLSYSASGLSTVTDQFGRQLTVGYADNSPYIQTLTGPDGQVTSFAYSSEVLNGIVWPDASEKKFVMGPASLLMGVIDENHGWNDGILYAQYAYDSGFRAIGSEHNGGVENFSVSNSTPAIWQINDVADTDRNIVLRTLSWQPPVGAVLTSPNGSQSSLSAGLVNGSPYVASRTQPAGSGCGAATSATTYDGSGNIASQDDFNGNRVCFASDTSRNLRLVSVEGMSATKACPASLQTYMPSETDSTHPERLTTTVWHPNWTLKAQEAEPKKVTTWVYNGQLDPIGGGTASCAPSASTLPDGKPLALLCSRYEQATTDATGALGVAATVVGPARKWSFTYNQFGQVLTATTPKQSATDSLSHTTSYTYYTNTSITSNAGHTVGDLQSVTNPLGQTTTFESYDSAGRLLSSIDPNGTVATQSYWPRGWLMSQAATPVAGSGAPQTTSYTYWPTGLLKTVTLADGSVLSYSYDDAHRLSDVTDAAGNKIHYVLDNVGNRTTEQVSDASGNLASTITRVFDALNRVQSQTGAPH